MNPPSHPIVLCVDDFALHPLIDQAVLQLASKGRISATSCSLLRLHIGVHFFAEFLRRRHQGFSLGFYVSLVFALQGFFQGQVH